MAEAVAELSTVTNGEICWWKCHSPSPSPQLTPSRKPTKPLSIPAFYYTSVFVASILVYGNALSCGFVFDDVSAIRDNRDLRPDTPIYRLFLNDFWGTPMHKEHSHKSYRPLTVLTFRLNYLLHELHPLGYHLGNVLLHSAVCCLYTRVVALFVAPTTALLAGLLFALHPIHTEAVTGVVGRAESLCSIFFLLSFLCYSRSPSRRTFSVPLICSILLMNIATLCKEQGITVVGVCGAYELLIVQRLRPQHLFSLYFLQRSSLRASLTKCVLLLFTALVLMFARIKVMGAQLPVFTKFDNPAAVADFPGRHLTLNYLLPVNLWLLLNPYHLCCDWTMGTIPIIEDFFDPRNAFTVAFYTVLVYVAFASCVMPFNQYRVLVFSLSLLVFPFLPASNLFFPVGFVVAERVLYLPSMGFCLLVAFGCESLYSKCSKYLVTLLVVSLLLSHAAKTLQRNVDWSSELSIFKSGLQVNTLNAKLYNNIGHALETDGKYDQALRYFLKASQVQPDDVGAHINVGRTYNNLKLYDEAEVAFLQAKKLMPRPRKGEKYLARIAPNYLNVFLNLGNLYARNSSRLEEADALYRQAISMRADYIQAYINRGDVLIKLNRTQEAREVYERALQLDRTNPDIYYNLGVVLIELGHPSDALQLFDKALELSPDHEQALMNSAILIQESGNVKLRPVAISRLNTLLQKGHDNERIWFNLAMLATDNKKYADAEKFFKIALKQKPSFRSALFNIALLLSDIGRPLDSIYYLQQLLKYHPRHTKALILLGDIYINHVKDLEKAMQCYEAILAIDSNNVQAKHNMCVVHVNAGRLDVAEKCLLSVQQAAPKEGYILKHLDIVRKKIEKMRTDKRAKS